MIGGYIFSPVRGLIQDMATIFPSIPCLVSGRRSEPIIILSTYKVRVKLRTKWCGEFFRTALEQLQQEAELYR